MFSTSIICKNLENYDYDTD